jgi:hypothetical protein
MAQTDLQQIQNTFRTIVRAPTPSQMSTDQVNQYINTFILYDLPNNMRLFNLRSTFTFYTQPNVATYQDSPDPNSEFYLFNQNILTVHQPIFIAGVQSYWSEWPSIFYANWPLTAQVAQTQLFGDGVTTIFNGILTGVPMLQNYVMFSATDATGTNQILTDNPISNTTGALGLPNRPQTFPSPYGSINYLTGAFSVNFPAAPAAQAPIYSETVPYLPGIPVGCLYYDSQFVLRPVPDKSYSISVEVDLLPTQLIEETDNPTLYQWWQLIAYGAALKNFVDKLDMDSWNKLKPHYDKQLAFVNTQTINTACNKRAETIFSAGSKWSGGWLFGRWPY